MQDVEKMAQEEPTPLTLQQMRSFANLEPKVRLVSAAFLFQELQKRYAHALIELHTLPLGLAETSSVQQVISKYFSYLDAIQQIGVPKTLDDDAEFTRLIQRLKADGSDIVPLICHGVKLRGIDSEDHESQMQLNQALDTFFLNRIGIRMLSGQHVEGRERDGGRVMMIDPERVARRAADTAVRLCISLYGKAPEVQITMAKTNVSSRFIYVESHLHHMIFELVKNSLRASVEYKPSADQSNASVDALCRIDPVMDPTSCQLGFVIPEEIDTGVSIYPRMSSSRSGEIPPVRIIISPGVEDLTIKLSDEGGGICRSDWSKMWHYTYTTDPTASEIKGFREQFSGGGYGLPIARLFARYFGGELTILPIERYGTDAFIQIHKLGKSYEVVPGHSNYAVAPLQH